MRNTIDHTSKKTPHNICWKCQNEESDGPKNVMYYQCVFFSAQAFVSPFLESLRVGSYRDHISR